MSSYAARTFDGVAQSSHLAKDNYFYLNCLTGGWVGGAGGRHAAWWGPELQ